MLGHDLYSPTADGKISGTSDQAVHSVHGLAEGVATIQCLEERGH